MTIDLNADAGESFGRWRVADEAALFPLLTSVNLACGFHAGEPRTMQAAVALAAESGVAVGAHPGFPDRVGFGRRDLDASLEEIAADVLYQLGALDGFLRVAGLRMHHVKAHGALYFRMMRRPEVARAVAEAVVGFDAALPVVVLAGPGGEAMAGAAREAGARVVAEAFPDRGYLKDGRLAPRQMAGALIEDPEVVAERALAMAEGRPFAALDGGNVQLACETLCLHGDNPAASANARAVRGALEAAGVRLQAF